MLKISVKGSQDGGWGLTQNYKKDKHTTKQQRLNLSFTKVGIMPA